jgi:hypothetical protein
MHQRWACARGSIVCSAVNWCIDKQRDNTKKTTAQQDAVWHPRRRATMVWVGSKWKTRPAVQKGCDNEAGKDVCVRARVMTRGGVFSQGGESTHRCIVVAVVRRRGCLELLCRTFFRALISNIACAVV